MTATPLFSKFLKFHKNNAKAKSKNVNSVSIDICKQISKTKCTNIT